MTPASPDDAGEPPANRRRVRLRRIAAGVLIAAAALSARPLYHVAATAWNDIDERRPAPPNTVDDASRLNRTAVHERWPVPADRPAAEAQLRALLKRARAEGLRVSVAGARHSMGGHTIYPGGIAIDMLPFNAMRLDETADLLHVGSGALWKDVIAYLDARGRSVAVMQSNNSFSVGGSISVNCHGWPYGLPPIASTVERFRLMKADGAIVTCSRVNNTELFSAALGGYGLFGIILDVTLRVVPNERYRLEQFVAPLEQSLNTFDREAREDPDVAMAYARLNITPGAFLDEVILNILHRDPAPDGSVPPLGEPGMAAIRRSLFRGSVGSDYGKALRWAAETRLQPHLKAQYFSRNQLLNEGVEIYENREGDATDILHEYFVPRDGVVAFVGMLQKIIPEHGADLLNVTVRHVRTDTDTLLRYADRPMFCFVMLFHQARSEEGERRMAALTGDLVDAALQHGGRYYLPYRLHATPQQFHRAYPQARRFFEFKRRHDPDELFQNRFYLKYGRGEATTR